jgi:pyridoxine 5-phosphate synthase
MIILGVNIDHIATIRQARQTFEPDPVEAAFLAEKGGAQCITVHLREDRRHIQDRDVHILKQTVQAKFNLEMSTNKGIVDVALSVHPDQVTIVPEKRQELTTEGGIDVVKNRSPLALLINKFRQKGILVSLFIDPAEKQVLASSECGADYVEFNTGPFSNAKGERKSLLQMSILEEMAQLALQRKLRINAGHGLTYFNVNRILDIPGIEELHIGHSIISRAVMVGMKEAVREMVKLISL